MTRSPLFVALAATIALLIGGTTAVVATPGLLPAHAADAAALFIEKKVDATEALAPGDEFRYTIDVSCADSDCLDVELVDPLPAAFVGFELVGAPRVTTSSVITTVTVDDCTVAGGVTTVAAGCAITVTADNPLRTRTGLAAGDGFTVTFTLKVPHNLTPEWSFNDAQILNTAIVTASNAVQSSAVAAIVVEVPTVVDVTVAKTWAPAKQQFNPGAESTLTLTAANASNAAAASLTLTDPPSALANADSLAAANPFRLVDFVGFGTVTLPQGASQVAVAAYTLASGEWVWVEGNPAATAALPVGVNAEDVAGLRFSFTGTGTAPIAADGAAASVVLVVAQRSTDRATADSLVLGATASNTVSATVEVPGAGSDTATASAPYEISGLNVDVSSSKSISPATIPAGGTAVAKISGANRSNGTLATLTVADNNGFFTDQVLFDGFTEAPTWPLGATTGTITWYVDGAATTPVALAAGSTPTAPALATGTSITGFALNYTGEIALGATAGANFTVRTTTALVPDAASSPAELENTVLVTGSNAAGTDTAQSRAPLEVYFPEISLSLDKKISPAGAIPVGGTVVSELLATTASSSRHVRPNQIEVIDEATGASNDFWQAFTPIAIAPTQVPYGSTLTVDYKDSTGTWHALTSYDATAEAGIFTHSIDPALAPGIVGLRFTFDTATAFGQGTSVSPNVVFEARSTLRDSGDPVAPVADTAATYRNLAVAQASGVTGTPGIPVTSTQVQDAADASVVRNPGTGQLYLGKAWLTDTIISQSAATADTRLSWGVPVAGYRSITISDPASDANNPQSTTFQAFDLTRIRPISYSTNPLLKWDRVTSIQLIIDGAPTTVAPPAGGWMNATGFVGYTLSSTQSAQATGVIITVEADDAKRAASNEATRPTPGSGIATGVAGANRYFDLQWTLRNTLRVPNGTTTWSTATTQFNVAGSPGVVRNTVGISGVLLDGTPGGSGTASDIITLLDVAPGVTITADVNRGTLVLPNPGDVDPSAYPQLNFTLNSESTSVSRASYLRTTTLTDCGPALPDCTTAATDWHANVFADAAYTSSNPFERVTLERLSFTVPGAQVSKAHSIVTLWHRASDGTLSVSTHTITQAEALTASSLADVVGVSVVYQAASPQTAGGSIVNGADLVLTMQTRVRETLRSGGAADYVSPTTIEMPASAQSYDPVLRATGVDSTPHAADSALVALVDGVLDVIAQKTIAPQQLLERNRHNDVTVTLSANDGNSTAATHQVILTDTDARFWDSASLTALGTVTLPAGADQVRVDVQLGDSTWVLGTAGPIAAIPTSDLAAVTGIRFTFDRADGGLFSNTAIPADWAASAVLIVDIRDTLRSTGAAIEFPATVENQLLVESSRTETVQIFTPARDDANANLTLATGTFGLDVVKSPADNIHTIDAGGDVEWTLRFSNTGTGYLDIEQLVDSLPADLQFTHEAPVYTTSAGGTLSTAVALAVSGGELTFTWPAGSRMSPGETFTIVLHTTLGLGSQSPVVNSFTVTTQQNLATCTNASGNGQSTLPGLPATECGTSNFVEQIAGASIFSSKSVRGEIDGTLVSGAIDTVDPTRNCVADADGFYRYPCAANTAVGASDEWKLTTVNSGTEAVTHLTVVEPLPTIGDRMLATGGSRYSTWRPVFDGSFGIDVSQVPAGTAVTWQVSTGAAVCVGTAPGSRWVSDPLCAADTWSDAASFTGDWGTVTGLRISFDFTTTVAGGMAPGEVAEILIRTINEPATAAQPGLAPTVAPVVDAQAWNQLGATADFASGVTKSRAPVRAGVVIPVGSLQVSKQITGDAAAHAPSEFLVDVSCTIAGVTMDLGATATLALTNAGNLTARIDGIPLGAECVVAEQGAVGEFDETSRSGDTATVSILLAGSTTDAVPATQQATIVNDYEWGSLVITKNEDRSFAAIGETVTYTITVENTGARTARDIVVTDVLPVGARVVATSPTADTAPGELSWEVDVLEPGETRSFEVQAKFDSLGRHINKATVTNPPGPWLPVTPIKPCTDDPEAACTNVTVLALTMTGAVGVDLAIAFALALLLLGLLLVSVTRAVDRKRARTA